MKFFRSKDSRPGGSSSTSTIPEGQRVYAVGDIHGCADLLDDLIAQIEADDAARGPAATTVIFLGDIVDRGPASAGVIDRLIAFSAARSATPSAAHPTAANLAAANPVAANLAAAQPTAKFDVRFLLGNHEEIFLGALDGEPKALRLFCRIGGRETVLSYGMDAAEYERLDYEELVQRLGQLVPTAHRTFLDGFEDLITIGDYAFVHAGVRPGTPLEDQRSADLRWIRDPFLDHRGTLAKMIVHGHTVTETVDPKPHRIGIDTGAYATGCLTALGLEGNQTWVLQTGVSTGSMGNAVNL